MSLANRPEGTVPRGEVTVELDDIQATVLRYRPEPYYGSHVMLHVDNAKVGREFLRRIAPHVDSAAEWLQAGEPWIAVAITYAGLAALELPEASLQSFPEAFRVGMAARAEQLADDGENDPTHWEPDFGNGRIHIGVSVFSDSEATWRRTVETARQHYVGVVGLTVLSTPDFGAQSGDLNPLGYRDSIGQPAIEGSGVEPLPGQGPAIKAGEFILGYPSETGLPLPAPQPDILGRDGTYAGDPKGLLLFPRSSPCATAQTRRAMRSSRATAPSSPSLRLRSVHSSRPSPPRSWPRSCMNPRSNSVMWPRNAAPERLPA